MCYSNAYFHTMIQFVLGMRCLAQGHHVGMAGSFFAQFQTKIIFRKDGVKTLLVKTSATAALV